MTPLAALKQTLALTLTLGICAQAAYSAPQVIRYMILDGQAYAGQDLELAARSPVRMRSPSSNGSGEYLIPMSPDGHYYAPATVNGFPVVFLVDTGAGMSVLPMRIGRNAGIRAGLVAQFSTAAGKAEGAVSERNVIVLGPFVIDEVAVAVQDKLDLALLGADVLNRFRITYQNGMLSMRAGAR
jgi:aspartyl protease family protein